MDATEPTYYVTTDFSGVGFCLNDGDVPARGTILIAGQVAPDVREAGRIWKARHA